MTIKKDRSFLLAERYVQETGVSVFLTGKAGTGKTTFLREIVRNTTKRCAVVAPTGVAAMNAGGVTIHSFFQLPLCPYLPDVRELVTEYQMPEKQRRVKRERIDIYRTLDLLIIDEISMVRADILDAVDNELRRYRRNDKPFGGVQLLMIGDIQQLPPVVKESERPFFEQVYPSPFFFCSKALARLNYIVVELEEIHRQKDRVFMDILNDIRSGTPSADSLEALNRRLDPFFEPPEDEKWIRLTTHNAQADAINRKEMDELDTEEKVFEADISGSFPETAYPAETSLSLKVGAQVMFIRNDSKEGRWYNGKVGTVSALDEDLRVMFEDGTEVSVEKEEWNNLRYELNSESNEIEAAVEGVFVQYPLRLAWAITIHKSQGLTFDRVIIDAGKAFSFGQVYVALSRCRSLEGIVLTTPISSRCTFFSPEVNSFEKTYTPPEKASGELQAHLNEYFVENLCDAFDFRWLRSLFNKVNRIFQVDLSNLYPSQAERIKALFTGRRVRGIPEPLRNRPQVPHPDQKNRRDRERCQGVGPAERKGRQGCRVFLGSDCRGYQPGCSSADGGNRQQRDKKGIPGCRQGVPEGDAVPSGCIFADRQGWLPPAGLPEAQDGFPPCRKCQFQENRQRVQGRGA